MQQQTAEAIAHATREEAERQAHDDLDQLRRQAVEAGRDRSRKTIKVTVINADTGAINYNPAGRLLRDWYLHVYINSLRAQLQQPREVVDRQDADEAADLLGRVRPEVDQRQARHAVAVGQMLAETDAAAAAAGITERLHELGLYRAIQHAPDSRFDSDQLRVHIARHWYQRCYERAVDEAVSARHPLAPVTEAEVLEVASALGSREARRIIGRDGVPPVAIPGMTPDAVVERVKQAWSDMNYDQRAEWLSAAKAVETSARSDWDLLGESQQEKLIRNYRDHCRGGLIAGRPIERRLNDSESDVARRMFNHSALPASQHSPHERDMQLPGHRVEDQDQQRRAKVDLVAPPIRGVH